MACRGDVTQVRWPSLGGVDPGPDRNCLWPEHLCPLMEPRPVNGNGDSVIGTSHMEHSPALMSCPPALCLACPSSYLSPGQTTGESDKNKGGAWPGRWCGASLCPYISGIGRCHLALSWFAGRWNMKAAADRGFPSCRTDMRNQTAGGWGSSPGSAPNSSFLGMRTLRGSRDTQVPWHLGSKPKDGRSFSVTDLQTKMKRKQPRALYTTVP